jgi:hypothetical protein
MLMVFNKTQPEQKMEHGSKDWTSRKSRDLKISQK